MKKAIIVSLLFFYLVLSNIYAGALEDVCNKTVCRSVEYTNSNSTHTPLVTPLQLISYPNLYCRNTIKMKVLFHGITTHTFNTYVGFKNSRHTKLGTKYISFSIKDPQGRISPRDIYLFISKGNPDSNKLSRLSYDTPIYVIGKVKDISKNKAWIEVEKIGLK